MLPGWTHHCSALSNALPFQNFTISLCIKLNYQILSGYPLTPLTTLVSKRSLISACSTRSATNRLLPLLAFKNSYGQKSFFYVFTYFLHLTDKCKCYHWTGISSPLYTASFVLFWSSDFYFSCICHFVSGNLLKCSF